MSTKTETIKNITVHECNDTDAETWWNFDDADAMRVKIKRQSNPLDRKPKVLCIDDPSEFYINPVVANFYRISFKAYIKQDLHERLKKQLKNLDKKIILYSRTRSYRAAIFGEDPMQDKIKATHLQITDDFNMFKYKYMRKTLTSEEAWLGIDIFGQNKEFNWWELNDEPDSVITN